MRGISQASAVLLCFLIWVCVSLPCLAQNASANSSATGSKNSSQAKDNEFAGKFWNYLLSNNYKQWSPVPGKTASYFSSGPEASGTLSPHGELVKTYVNRIAAGDPESLPVGSILIMENYRQDRSLETISVMYRTANYNPTANDWYWVNYNADGTVASQRTVDYSATVRTGVQQASAVVPLKRKMVGRSVSCIACHKSGGDDLAFFNHKSYTQIAAAPMVASLPKVSQVGSVTPPVRTVSVTSKAKPKSISKPKSKARPKSISQAIPTTKSRVIPSRIVRRPRTVNRVPKRNVFYPATRTRINTCPT